MSLLVLCPSRGRPDSARELLDTFQRTKSNTSSYLAFVVDIDDPTAGEYPRGTYVIERGRPGMVDALNRVAGNEVSKYGYIGFVGDDHRFRTKGWDNVMLAYLSRAGGGFAYANDLLQGENLPTAVFVSSEIVKELGYFAPPNLAHLYVDDSWKLLGDGADCLYYFPDIIIEHMHPYAGKAEWDEGYKRVNDSAVVSADRWAYEAWVAGEASADIARVREALRQLQADIL